MKSTKELINVSLNKLQQQFDIFDEISLKNTAKVLDAFAKNNVALRHFNGTSGYGNDDIGRDTVTEKSRCPFLKKSYQSATKKMMLTR